MWHTSVCSVAARACVGRDVRLTSFWRVCALCDVKEKGRLVGDLQESVGFGGTHVKAFARYEAMTKYDDDENDDDDDRPTKTDVCAVNSARKGGGVGFGGMEWKGDVAACVTCWQNGSLVFCVFSCFLTYPDGERIVTCCIIARIVVRLSKQGDDDDDNDVTTGKCVV